MEIFGTWITCSNSAGFRTRMPIVNCIVVLDARIGAFPGGLRHLAEQALRVDCLEDLPGHPGGQAEGAALLHGPHELVGYPYRVVCILVLDASDVFAAEVHVEPSIAQDTDLFLFPRLG